MTDRHEIEARVLALFAKQGWEEISLSDRVEQDLCVRGDDLYPIEVALHEEFDVDFSSLDYERFFHGEYFRFRDMIWYLAKKIFGREYTDREECTVAHLVDVAEQGYWTDP